MDAENEQGNSEGRRVELCDFAEHELFSCLREDIYEQLKQEDATTIVRSAVMPAGSEWTQGDISDQLRTKLWWGDVTSNAKKAYHCTIDATVEVRGGLAILTVTFSYASLLSRAARFVPGTKRA